MKIGMKIAIALGLGLKRNAHIFVGLIAGMIVGAVLHSNIEKGLNPHVADIIIAILSFVGQAFIRLIQMVVIPLVISAIVIGIASIGDNKQLGKFGTKMILYYGLITLLAVTVGAILVCAFTPGVGVQSFINAESSIEIQEHVANQIANNNTNILGQLLTIIPKNPLEAMAKGDMLPIILFTLVFSVALARVGDINRPVVSFFESVFAATMKVTDWIMFFAVPGVFALSAVAVADFGMSIFGSISKLLAVLVIGFLIQLLIIYPAMMKIFSKVPVGTFYSAIAEAMMVAFGTASSSATLPLTMACCERRGISHKVCSFVLPLGATLNMDATALFQTVAVIFLTQAYGVELGLAQVVQIALLAVIASSTSAGIPGAGLITIALVLNGLGLTPEQVVVGFAFLMAFERVIDMLRTMVNVTSDAVVAAMIADNENEINYDLLNNPEAYQEVI